MAIRQHKSLIHKRDPAIWGQAARVASGLSQSRAVAYMAERYGWDPKRVEGAILKLAAHFGSTNEVFYSNPQNYREVTVVWVIRQRPGRYEIREENRAARLALDPGVRYTSVVPVHKTASVSRIRQEAHTMPARARRAPSKAKPAPDPEPEEELEIDDELEDEEEEEELEVEDVGEDEEEEEVEDEDEEDEEDEDEEDEDEAKDYTPYAGKAPTATMKDFADWLLDEVYADELPEGHDEQSFREGVRLGGTLRMEFQRSDFCRQRREERKAESATAKKAAPKKAKEPEPELAPAKKAAGKPTAARRAAASAPTTVPATGKTARTVPGRPAPRAADRPARAAKATGRPARRGKATEEPF